MNLTWQRSDLLDHLILVVGYVPRQAARQENADQLITREGKSI